MTPCGPTVSMGRAENTTGAQAAFGAASGSSSIRPFLSDFNFPVLNLSDSVTLTLYDAKTEVPIGRASITVPSIVEKGFRDEFVSFSSGGRIHVKTTFVLTDEERAKISLMRVNAAKKKQEAAAAAATAGGAPKQPTSLSLDVPKPASAASVVEANGSSAPAAASLEISSPPIISSPPEISSPRQIPTPEPAASPVLSPTKSNSPPRVRTFSPAHASSPSPPVSSPSLTPRSTSDKDSIQTSFSGGASPQVREKQSASPASNSADSRIDYGGFAGAGSPGKSEVDTSPFDQVRNRIKAIENLKKEVEKAPAGSVTRQQASERLRHETAALAAAEELRRQELRRRGVDVGDEQALRKATEESSNGEDMPLNMIVKQVAGGVAAIVVALLFFWPKGNRRRKVYVVKPGDRLAGIIPEHYCNPNSRFYELNPEVCERNYIYEGQHLYLP